MSDKIKKFTIILENDINIDNVVKTINEFNEYKNEINEYEKFIKSLPKKYKSLPKEIIFSFGSGIGVGIDVKVGDKKKDITDYGCW